MSRLREAFDRLGPTLRTAAHLRPAQLAAQLLHRARGPARSPAAPRADGCHRVCIPEDFAGPSPEGTVDEDGGVVLLGQPPHDPVRFGWDGGDDPLWAYTLHYHGWLAHPSCRFERARATVLGWIDEHPHGVGWEPYPTSMRVFSWLGWLGAHAERLPTLELERVLSSLAAQLLHLAAHVEHHLDGNHLWTNLAALVAGALALEGPVPRRLARAFAAELVGTVEDQLADDGVHGERTPTYHCLLAEQLDMVVTLARVHDGALEARLGPALQCMGAALPAFTHPDGDVALWGDSQRGAPVRPDALARRLGSTLGGGHADDGTSGFSRRAWGPWSLLWNRGGVGLPHQVGHIHADALSIELSLGEERVVVDAGAGTYTPGAERTYARSTTAHNTVTVGAGDPDQHEMWASHRIGARAVPIEVERSDDRIVGRIRGHRSPADHVREITWQGGRIRIVDRVDARVAGNPVPATVRYHLPATARVEEIDQGVRVTARTAGFDIVLHGGHFVVQHAPGWRALGSPAPRIMLATPLSASGATVELVAR
jgi:hypothetical protein